MLLYFAATQLWRNKAAKIANNHKEVKFAIADEDEHSHLLAEFGLDDSGEEINIACYGPDGKKFPMEPMEEWESEDIEEFITKMKKGEQKCWKNFDCIYMWLKGLTKNGLNMNLLFGETNYSILGNIPS